MYAVFEGLPRRRPGEAALFFNFGREFAFLLFLESGQGRGTGGIPEGEKLFLDGGQLGLVVGSA